eukprot:TRINITY_DN7046_c2_g1_i1.p1 TRINITY_DN7046_c2_g1~~TRINITY_DN7046_c2_g1_i1.p1  ORF type:complete len:215 (+),score=48.99 TRINITY_DN7046_c2_g1_i1:48-692(+)
MGYGTNGENTNGTLMNVGNSLNEKPSIRLLGRERGYDTGHAMAALLGIRSVGAEEVSVKGRRRPQLASTPAPTPATTAGRTPILTSTTLKKAAATKLEIGMKIITIKKIDLHSGITLSEGAVGVVKKIPGDLKGTIAEVDIHDGPLFDAWPGTITVFTPPSIPSLDLSTLSITTSERRAVQMKAAGVGSKKCGNCRKSATYLTRFCTSCGLALN